MFSAWFTLKRHKLGDHKGTTSVLESTLSWSRHIVHLVVWASFLWTDLLQRKVLQMHDKKNGLVMMRVYINKNKLYYLEATQAATSSKKKKKRERERESS